MYLLKALRTFEGSLVQLLKDSEGTAVPVSTSKVSVRVKV